MVNMVQNYRIWCFIRALCPSFILPCWSVYHLIRLVYIYFINNPMFLYLFFLSKDKTGMITVWNYSHFKTDYIATWKRDFCSMLFNPNQKVTATEMKAKNQYRHIFRKKMENSSNSFAIITNVQSYLYKQLSTTFMVFKALFIYVHKKPP